MKKFLVTSLVVVVVFFSGLGLYSTATTLREFRRDLQFLRAYRLAYIKQAQVAKTIAPVAVAGER